MPLMYVTSDSRIHDFVRNCISPNLAKFFQTSTNFHRLLFLPILGQISISNYLTDYENLDQVVSFIRSRVTIGSGFRLKFDLFQIIQIGPNLKKFTKIKTGGYFWTKL